jgi:hypothetical protein
VGTSRTRSAAVALGLALLTLCLPGAAGAAEPGRSAPVVEGAASPAAAAVPTELTALVADFDGDHHRDGRGFRVFEADVVRLADGTALLAHTGLEANYGLSEPFQDSTWADLSGHKYLGRYTILRSQDLVGLLRSHPDAYAILDSKYAEVEIYRSFIRQAPERSVRERMFPHVVDQAMLNALRTVYPLQNYVLALYRTQYYNRYDDPEVVDFTRRNRAPAVAMWWRERDPTISLNANHFQNRRYRASFVSALRAAGAISYVHSLDDPADVQRFWDLRVGVYSNEPFPPLGTTPPLLLPPRFSRGVTPA